MLFPIFEKEYGQYLTVYKVPIAPGQLDPTVFYIDEQGSLPILLPIIQTQIAKDLEMFIGADQTHRIKGYYLVGPATIPGNKNRSGELTVLINLNKNIKDTELDSLHAETILQVAKELSNRLATGTTRKINYIPTIRSIDEFDYDGIYDIENNSWIKIPNGVTSNVS